MADINYFDAIFEKACDALTGSKKMKPWFDANYPGEVLHIYDGVLKEDPPEKDYYPIIAFSDVDGINRGDEVPDNEFLLSVGCAIYNDKKFGDKFYEEIAVAATPETVDSIIRKYPGKQVVNDFWLIVSSEILSIKGLYCKITSEGVTNYQEAYPIFKFSGTFRFSFKRELRTGNRL